MYQKALAIALLLATVSPVFAQTAADNDQKLVVGELRKEAIAFLRETMGDVANMRTLENRISFSAELANLMWFHDEREAKNMFNSAIADFRELIAQLDARMNAFPEEEDGVSGIPMRMFGDASDRAKLEMKYRVAMAVRQQIANGIQVVLQVSRLPDGTRKIISISEVVGMEGDVISMQELFQYERQGLDGDGKVLGRFRPTGIRPKFTDVLEARGMELSGSLFLDVPGEDASNAAAVSRSFSAIRS